MVVVSTATAHQNVVPAAARQHVRAGIAFQGVGKGRARQVFYAEQDIALCITGVGARLRQTGFDPRYGTFISGCISALATAQSVCPRTTRQDVIAPTAVEFVDQLIARQLVIELRANDPFNAGQSVALTIITCIQTGFSQVDGD